MTEAAREGGRPWRDRTVLSLTALALTPLYATQVYSADTWWHLATGRWMVENGRIPSTDPFAFTTGEAPWIYIDWLPELVMYGVWSMGGFAGLVWLQLALAAGILLAVGLAARRTGADLASSVATVVVAGILLQPRYTMMRPNVFGALLLAVGVWLLVDWFRRPSRRIWALPAILALWLPTHGSAVLGLGLALLAAAVETVHPRPPWRRTAWAVALTAVALFAVTEAGRHVVQVIGGLDSLAIEFTSEWRRTDPRMPRTWVPLAFVAVALVFGLARWRRALGLLGLVLAAAWLARGYTRNLAEAVVLAAPLFALAVSTARVRLLAANLRLAAAALPVAVALGLPGLHLSVEPELALNTRFGFGSDESNYPHDTLELLRTLPEGRTINNFGIGGYLIWHEIPGGVFADGRNVALYTDAMFRDFIAPTMDDEAALNAVADRFEVQWGLVTFESMTGRVMMTVPSWIPVMHGESSTLFVRREHAHQVVETGTPLLNELRWDKDAEWTRGWYDAVLASPEGRSGLVEALRVSAAQRPDNPVLARVVPLLAERDPAILESAFGPGWSGVATGGGAASGSTVPGETLDEPSD